jgi:hypothetical protein
MSHSRRGRTRGQYHQERPTHQPQTFSYDVEEEKESKHATLTLGGMHVKFSDTNNAVYVYNLPTSTHSQLEAKDSNVNPLDTVQESQPTSPKTISVKIPTVPLEQVVRAPNIISDTDPNKTAEKIAFEFNRYRTDGSKAITQTSYWWPGAIKLNQGEFLLAERDGFPELAAYTPNYLCEASSIFNFNSKVIFHNRYTLKNELFGLHGTYVLVVPEGSYGRAVVDHKHVLLDEGIHVIHGTYLHIDRSELAADKRLKEFSWGNTRIVQVKAGTIGKVIIDSQPYLLEHSPRPYCFVTAMYTYEGLESSDEPFFEHVNLTRAVLKSNELAVVNRSGKEELIAPPENGDPILFTRSTDKVNAIISTSFVTKTFPNQPDNFNKDPLNTGYVFCSSQDGIEIAFKINITYRIAMPNKLLNQGLLFRKGIDEIAILVEQGLVGDLKRIIQTTDLKETLIKRQSAEPKDPNFKLFDKSDSLNQNTTDSLHANLREKLQSRLDTLGVEIKDINLILQPCLILQAQAPSVMERLAKQDARIREIYSFFSDPATAQQKVKQRQAEMEADAALASKTDTSLSSRPSMSASKH